MRILQFFSEDNGNLSATRLGFLAWALGLLGSFIYVAVTTKAMPNVPENAVWVLVALMTGKAVQKFGEKPPQ